MPQVHQLPRDSRTRLSASLAGDALTTGNLNVAVGMHALGGDTVGSRSTALGYSALLSQNFTTATNVYNVAVGYEAGKAVTIGKIQ